MEQGVPLSPALQTCEGKVPARQPAG